MKELFGPDAHVLGCAFVLAFKAPSFAACAGVPATSCVVAGLAPHVWACPQQQLSQAMMTSTIVKRRVNSWYVCVCLCVCVCVSVCVC